VKRQGSPHEKATGHDRFGVRNGLAMMALAVFVVLNLVWSGSPSPKRKPVHETRMSALERLEYKGGATRPLVWAVAAEASEQND